MRVVIAILVFTEIAGPALRGQSPTAARPVAQTAPASGASGQSSKKRLTFDVASVKSVRPPNGVTVSDGGYMIGRGAAQSVQIPRNTGGPGSDDPGRIHYPLITLKELLRRGWGDSYFEIQSPDWLGSQTVAIDATMPRDTTKEQFREMLRNLITDRFGLKYHAEARAASGYILVLAKNGPKMKESTDQTEGVPGPRSAPTGRTPDGFPIVPPRTGSWCDHMETPDRRRIVCQQQTMQGLAHEFGNLNVTDATGLRPRYDFTLTYAGGIEPSGAPVSPLPEAIPEGVDSLPDIFSAVQSQLGLRLEPRKAPVEVMVVDHIEKAPTRN